MRTKATLSPFIQLIEHLQCNQCFNIPSLCTARYIYITLLCHEVRLYLYHHRFQSMGFPRIHRVGLLGYANVSSILDMSRSVSLNGFFHSYFRKAEKYTPHPSYPGINAEERGKDGLWSTVHSREALAVRCQLCSLAAH